ncbi:hypothetical protein A2V49_00810 [candidate division WWE3 bacterium RBG_19FT_COMBO_34_6]|uniref:Uncharacterized protein n=1 Tax=candidate division WWE3 bacterium RBG_19FT_COMBO_34_6 TaxID=1802612 RepID=A0A1F4UM99_UNCKA|nr:MAG: hypothetical protein A2V49_00810 [candidate division WWE3 bacterium RBG_19FT_COMBO_34_6]
MGIRSYASRVTPLSKAIALILFVSLPFTGFFIGVNYKNNLAAIYSRCRQNIVKPLDKIPVPASYYESSKYKLETMKTFKGVIKKEEVPKELELGDYWYFLYFDEPYLCTQCATGFPVFMEKIEIWSTGKIPVNLDNYINKHVITAGTLGWGYAESTIFSAEAIAELE